MGVNQTVYTELRNKYTAAWVPPTEYPNEAFTKPAPAVIWARFTITSGEERGMDIGSVMKTHRINGVLTIQLFAPQSQGVVTVLKMADTVADIFRNWCGNTVTCRSASVRDLGNDGFGWHQINIDVPFHSDALH